MYSVLVRFLVKSYSYERSSHQNIEISEAKKFKTDTEEGLRVKSSSVIP